MHQLNAMDNSSCLLLLNKVFKNAMKLIDLSVSELSQGLNNKSFSSRDVAQAFIERTEQMEPHIGAFISWDAEDLLAQAQASDARRAQGQALSPLDGIPVGIKDLLAVKGHPLTCSSRILENFVSPYDAGCTERLKAAGLLPWGRLNMDEFAMGSATEYGALGKTQNPWNTDYVPGGSSGGSAACVAAQEAPISIGSDTGGSIRQPAAFCGIVGLKPTYGSVSRYGMVAFSSSLDQLGPMGRSTEDVAWLFGAMTGHDPRDTTSAQCPHPDPIQALKANKGPWTLGVPKEFFAEGLDPEVAAAVRATIDFYKEQGCALKEVSLPRLELAIPIYFIISSAEASSNLARFDGVRYTRRSPEAQDIESLYSRSRAEGFGPEVKRRIILGTYVLSANHYEAYYRKAQCIRRLIAQDLQAIFKDGVDALITPTTPTPAFRIGSKQDPLALYLNDIYTTSANLAGLPALSAPCGLSKDGLPIGFQLIGPAWQDTTLLSIAAAHEHGRPFHIGKPPAAGV